MEEEEGFSANTKSVVNYNRFRLSIPPPLLEGWGGGGGVFSQVK